jgi:NADH-quinone oxidoreductase subunit C
MDVFPSAEFYEREIHDFFNIEFKGNLRLHEKMFLPDGWKGRPPLQKNKR